MKFWIGSLPPKQPTDPTITCFYYNLTSESDIYKRAMPFRFVLDSLNELIRECFEDKEW